MRKLMKQGFVVAVGAVVAVATLGRNTPAGRGLRRAAQEGSRRLRYLRGWSEGARYRLAGAGPDRASPTMRWRTASGRHSARSRNASMFRACT
jgi:hypothetical protein